MIIMIIDSIGPHEQQAPFSAPIPEAKASISRGALGASRAARQ